MLLKIVALDLSNLVAMHGLPIPGFFHRPDWKKIDSDWCEAYFDNHRHFIGSFGIFQDDDENFPHDLMRVKDFSPIDQARYQS